MVACKARIIITTLLTFVALTGWAQKSNFTISGDFSIVGKIFYAPTKVLSVQLYNDSTVHLPLGKIQEKCTVKDDTYGIAGIPRIILFAPDGTIVANGLRGENIEKKLAEIFNDK